MPPQRRTGAKAKDSVSVTPASAAEPRSSTVTQKEVAAAVEQSAEFLEQQAAPPTDVHPKPTTPTQAEVESAVEQSAEFLQSQGVATSDAAPVAASRDKGTDAAPVSAGGANPGLDAAPVYGGRDKTQDASPAFSAPVPDKPAEE